MCFAEVIVNVCKFLLCGVAHGVVAMYVLTSRGFIRSACRLIWFSLCEAVSMVLSASPSFFIQSNVFIISPSDGIAVVWARSLDIISELWESGMCLGSE